MSFLNVKNNASSVLASAITDVATSLTVATGEGARFPSSNFHITIDDEILLCTTRTGDVLTVTRAQEDTSAAAHGQGIAVRLNITAKVIEELQSNKSQVVWKDASQYALQDSDRSTTLEWTDLDLSAFVSSSAKLVYLKLMLHVDSIAADGGAILGVRKNGTTPDDYPASKVDYKAGDRDGIWYRLHAWCGLDANQVLEYSIAITGTIQVDSTISVLGYIE